MSYVWGYDARLLSNGHHGMQWTESSIRSGILNENIEHHWMIFTKKWCRGWKSGSSEALVISIGKEWWEGGYQPSAGNHISFVIIQYPINGFYLLMDVKRVKLRGGLRHVRGQPGQLRGGGRDARCECDRDVHGRVEERQAVWVWNQRTLGWSQVRRRVVQQQVS